MRARNDVCWAMLSAPVQRSGSPAPSNRWGRLAHVRRLKPTGFTLIELLIVISIIALLIGLLLPGLASARESARAVICTSNQRQLIMGMITYAGDYRRIPGSYHQGPQNLEWSGRMNAVYTQAPQNFPHPIHASPMAEYLSTLDRIMECPTGKRQNDLFDYTMVIRMAGAQIDLPWMARYPLRPEVPNSETRFFQSLPLLIEEHDRFFNMPVNDGSWAWGDQITRRHNGSGSIAYLDGTVSLFKPPHGGNDLLEEPGDLRATHVKLVVRSRIYDLHHSNPSEYGWVNRPR